MTGMQSCRSVVIFLTLPRNGADQPQHRERTNHSPTWCCVHGARNAKAKLQTPHGGVARLKCWGLKEKNTWLILGLVCSFWTLSGTHLRDPNGILCAQSWKLMWRIGLSCVNITVWWERADKAAIPQVKCCRERCGSNIDFAFPPSICPFLVAPILPSIFLGSSYFAFFFLASILHATCEMTMLNNTLEPRVLHNILYITYDSLIY